MPNPPSAAQSLYPHLQSGAREPIKQSEPKLSAAMWPSLAPKELSREELKEAWRDYQLALAGLKRRR